MNELYYFNGDKIREQIQIGQDGANTAISNIKKIFDKLDGGTAKATFKEELLTQLRKEKLI